MNNLFKLILVLFFSCSYSNQNKLSIIQKETNQPVYTIISNDTKRIVRVCFPKEIEIKNSFSQKKSFIKIDYQYNSLKTSIGNFINLYEEKDETLSKISNNKKKIINPEQSLNFTLYTIHYLDKEDENSLHFYQEKMLKENKDTLHIGTIQEFKKTHKELFEKLTKNDSISIQFLDGKKLGERITLPVKW